MKGKIMLAILDAIAEAPGTIFDGFAAFLEAGHGASYGKMMQKFDARQAEYDKYIAETRLRQRYRDLISSLKRDGLILEQREENKRTFRLTAKGKEKHAHLKKFEARMLPRRIYTKEKSTAFTIVAFDVPEKEKWKREWLRKTLRQLELKMIQKSVWMGKIKIPQQLLEDLKSLQLLESIEIFQITKTGTLRHIA